MALSESASKEALLLIRLLQLNSNVVNRRITMQRLTLPFIAAQAEKEAPALPDDRQRSLSRDFLWAERDSLEQDLLRLRTEFDRTFLASNPTLVQRYPIGCCREISNGVLSLLKRDMEFATSPGVVALRRFCAAGGAIRPVWGDLRRSYFQNAWQIGDLYVDVANDSVVRTKPKVEILPFDQAEFYAIKDYESYAHLAESYWHTRVIPNRYLPLLAPLYPMLLVYPNGRIKVHSPYQTPLYQNLLSNHELAERFTLVSSWSAARLSPSEVTCLVDLVKGVQSQKLELNTAPLTDVAMRRIFEEARTTELRFDVQRCQNLVNLTQDINSQEMAFRNRDSLVQ